MKTLINFNFLLALTFALSPAYAVVNGKAAADKIFESVGSLKIGQDNRAGCTATLVANNWIITARHCAEATEGSEEDPQPLKPNGFEFRLGNDFKKPLFKSKIKRWVKLDPETDITSEAADVALGELVTTAPIAKLQLNPMPIGNQNWSNDDLTANYIHIGYGAQIPFSNVKLPLTDKRQMAHFNVTSINGNALLNLFKTTNALQSYIEKFHPNIDLNSEPLDSILVKANLVADYSIHAWDSRGRTDLTQISKPASGWQDTCFGDSGGPLLREQNQQLEIVGVVSSGMNGTCEALGTKFSTFGPKVRDMMKSIGVKP